MSRGLGRIQRECLRVIESYEAAGKIPTTINVAAKVYQIKPDRQGVRWINDAQYTATKRALAGLRRKGLVNGQQALGQFPDGRMILARCSVTGRGAERCCFWSTAAHQGLAVDTDDNLAKSDRRIAAEIGVSISTLRRARAAQRKELIETATT